MNKPYLLLIAALFSGLLNRTFAQHIPDAQFAGAIRTVCAACIDGSDNLTPTAAFLTDLNVDNKGINDLTGIGGFTSLDKLYCEFNNLTYLPPLPASLTQLFCQSNNLGSLPALPSGLLILSLKSNNLYALPDPLPSNLNRININQNHISSLPALPSTLESLSAYSNTLTSLPSPLPSSLKILGVNTNLLTSIPELSSILTFLDCAGNSGLMCLPFLPNTLTTLDVTGTNITCIMNKPSGLTTSLPICNGSNGCPVLPIELADFQVFTHKDNIEIQWTTAYESNLLYFTVERSDDAIKFYPLSIQAPKGNDFSKTAYNFADNNPLNGVHYYRLKIEEKDGVVTYSRTLSARWGSKKALSVYPNPFNQALTIDLSDAKTETVHFEIMDMTGRVHISETFNIADKISTENLPSGMYILRVIQDGAVLEKKILKQ
jgi:hypothetical protein